MTEIMYDIEISQTPQAYYVAKMRSYVRPRKPLREYRGTTFEEMLEQIIRDILDENED